MAHALSLRGISKRFGPVTALDDVSFAVAPGSIHALIGANGSGKSTLIRVVAGIERAAPGGTLHVDGHELPVQHLSPHLVQRAGVRVVHQGSTVFPDLTVAENIGVGSHLATRLGGSIRWAEANRRAADLLEQLGLDVSPRAAVGGLSPAVQTLVAVARAFADEHDGTGPAASQVKVMILDEPTAALPAREVEILLAGLRRLADGGCGVVLVTHRLDEVARAADEATVLRDGRHVATFAVGEVAQADVVDMITGTAGGGSRPAVPAVTGPPRLQVTGLHVGAVHDVSFTVHEQEVVGIAGLLGSGRSTVLEALFGARPVAAGQVLLDQAHLDLRSPARALRSGVALVPEQRERAVFADQSVADNLSITDLPRWWNGFWLDRGAERRAAASDVEGFRIVARAPDAAMATLSGGNQQKVVLARTMRRSPRVLLLDEPTLGVDVGARAEIHEMIRRYTEGGGAALCVSSDVEELCSLTDRIIVLRGGRLTHQVATAEITPDALNQLVHREEAA